MILAGMAAALLLSSGVSQASTALNEVGAFLVYPVVVAIDPEAQPGQNWQSNIETYLSIVHTGDEDVFAHVVFINGNDGGSFGYENGHHFDEYCYECNYSLPLTPNDAELLTVRYTSFGVQIDSEDDTLQGACPHPFGMVTVNLEDPIGNVITDNTLLGSEVVINYARGWAFSIPAIPFQGQNGGDGDRRFEFDGDEYGAFPRVVAADFIAPDLYNRPLSAFLVLFTLGFQAEFPPATHCEIEGFDAAENPFSRSFNFGCWTLRSLESLHPEFVYGNLGQQACEFGEDCDTHGWLKLDCDVTSEEWGDTIQGGVHGAIIQVAGQGAKVRRNDPNAPALSNAAAWARLLYQSVTTGGPVTYHVAGPGGGLD
jgi:hypothetical protein